MARGSDEIAAQLAHAWRELLDARGVALWALRDDGRLEPLGRAGEFDGQSAPDTHIEFAQNAWPARAFWVAQNDGAARDLATTLGLLSEMVAAPSLCVPLGCCALALFWLDSSDGRFDDHWKEILEPLSAQSGALLNDALRAEKMGRSFLQLAQAMAAAIDGREAHRQGYSQAVAYYAGLIGREMNLSEADLERIEFAALWHGLGRLSVPDAILQKDAPLSSEELEQVRGAAKWGADKLLPVEGLEKSRGDCAPPERTLRRERRARWVERTRDSGRLAHFGGRRALFRHDDAARRPRADVGRGRRDGRRGTKRGRRPRSRRRQRLFARDGTRDTTRLKNKG